MTTTPQAALLTPEEIDAIATKAFCDYMEDRNDDQDLAFARLIEQAILSKLQATQEPVQAGELPPLPHDGWPARFRCDSCDGNGEIGELISMGHFQPPERQTCPDCGGRGWSDEGPAFNADHMRDYARAALSARKPLSRDQVKALKDEYGYSCAPVQAQADFINGIRCGEKAHDIGLEVKT